MIVPFVVGFVAATTQASSGPETAERAAPVALPVRDVVVFSDRARVTRRGPVHFQGGVQVLRAPDLPGATMPGTIRVTATGSNVVRVETRPVERERFGIEQVDAWIASLEALQDKEAVVNGKLVAVRGELGLLQGLQAAPPLPEKDRLGKPLAPSPEAWKDAAERLARRRVAARDAERALEEELRLIVVERERLQREIESRDVGAYADTRTEVVVIVDGAAGDGSLDVEYAVPGASWKPAYDLHFDPEKGTVQLAAAGLVSQASGEDWADTHLALSTSIPGEGLVLPKLRTWTLGDDREFVPVPTPRTAPPAVTLFLPPTPRVRAAEVEREADRTVQQERLAMLSALIGEGAGGLGLRGTGPGGGGAGGDDAERYDEVAPAPAMRKRALLPPPPPPAPSAMSAPMSSPMPSVAMSESYATDDDEGGASTDARKPVSSDGTRTRGLRLSSRDAWQRPMFSDPFLPAVSAAGFDAVYDAPLPATVPSQAQSLRVPLAARDYAVTTFYEATPSLSTTAYLKATVKNGTGLPILAGPANVFVGGAFTGDATLQTTGPGGTIELPLGADEDIRLTRTVIPSTSTKGFMIGEQDVTDYAVKIEVGNYKKRAITIRVVDQIPKTAAEKVEIQLVSSSPKAQALAGDAVDGDGLLSFLVDVPAGGTKTITFTYRVARPKDWRLSQ
jgi:hypothetical protein